MGVDVFDDVVEKKLRNPCDDGALLLEKKQAIFLQCNNLAKTV